LKDGNNAGVINNDTRFKVGMFRRLSLADSWLINLELKQI